MYGIRAFSYQASVICSGENETKAAPCSLAVCSARETELASFTESESVNRSQGNLASCTPIHSAWFLPTQPAGNSPDSRRRKLGIFSLRPRTTLAVASVD